MPEIKTEINVKILPVLAPENSGANGGSLEYGPENIKTNIENRLQEPVVWAEFMSSEPGSLEERKSARDLSEIFLGASAVQLMNSVKDASTISKQAGWLTQQSIDLYGVQDPSDTVEVMRQDMSVFSTLRESELVDQDDLAYLMQVYENLGIESDDHVDQNIEKGATLESGDIAFKEFLQSEFGSILDFFDAETLYTAQDLVGIATEVISKFSNSDGRWAGWKVTTKNDGSMSVATKEKEIKIGLKRAPSLGSEAGPSLLHEIADHAFRSVNGEETGNTDLQYGISGYIDFEEGLGCYMEYVLTGRVPSKISNRQIAASLALGQLGDGKRYNRNEIFDILALRTKILLQGEGSDDKRIHDAKTKELRTLIIDRFFRGGRGVEPAMSVYTKDIVYAEGFAKAKEYVNEQIRNGVDPKRLFKFLLSAKFDPTIKEHIDKLKNVGVEL